MINFSDLDNLYVTMAKDLEIPSFSSELEDSYHARIVYSCLGKWIMQLFADRDFETISEDQVSKNHVTISGFEVLKAFKNLDGTISDYFSDKDEDEEKVIKEIEQIYVNLGYINSGNYCYKYQQIFQRISLGQNSLVINSEPSIKRMVGLGIIDFHKEKDIMLNDYHLIQISSEQYFRNLIKSLKFKEFDRNYHEIKIYNVLKNKWVVFCDKELIKYKYYIIRTDYIDYRILKKSEGELVSALLKPIYQKGSNDLNFENEVWRIILGLCAYNEMPATATIIEYCQSGIKIDLNGFLIPFNEFSLLKCMAWPLNCYSNHNNFVTYKAFKEPIVSLLEHLSIKVFDKVGGIENVK